LHFSFNALCSSLISKPDTQSIAPNSQESSARDPVRDRSKALFGNQDRLQVATAIARSQSDTINATDLSLELGMLNSRVRAQLIALADAGLLMAGPPTGGKRWYVRLKSPFWQTCIHFAESWGAE
jgi:hypothetical protein